MRRIAGALLMLFFLPVGIAGSASIATAEPRRSSRALLLIQTVPALAKVTFSVDGSRFRANRDGIARLMVSRSGPHRLTLLDPTVRAPGLRARFVRWGDGVFSVVRPLSVNGGGTTSLQVGFDVKYRIHPVFVDERGRVVDPTRVDDMTFSNNGGRSTVGSDDAPWVPGLHVVRRPDGLYPVRVAHSILAVEASGSNVVSEGQQRFYAAPNGEWHIQVLFYDLQISVRDRFFGFPVGSTISLEFPDGHVRQYRLGPGATIAIPSLPRGDYRVTVNGPGLALAAPTALSRNQQVGLVFLSFVDVATVASLGLTFFVGLAALRRRRVRRSAHSPIPAEAYTTPAPADTTPAESRSR